MTSCCWNGPLRDNDKYKKCLEENEEQKEREVLTRWMERTQQEKRAREGEAIQACWMFLMPSLGIHLLKEPSVCCGLRISPRVVLGCSGKREKTQKGEKSLLSLAGAGELNKTQLSSVCKDLFFTEGRGALWLYIIFVSPHLRRCISGDFAADCALCIERKETSWMPFPPRSTNREGRGETRQQLLSTRMQENVAISMKNSIKKGNSEHCLQTPLLPPFPGAETWLEHFASILLNHPGRWIWLVLPRGAGSLFLAEVYLQGEILETNLAHTDFGLGSLKPRCKQKEAGEEGCCQ